MTGQRPPSDRSSAVPLAEAARRLELSDNALRLRIRRGAINADKRDGRWYVVVPDQDDRSADASTTSATSHDRSADQTATVAALRDSISLLRDEVAFLRVQARERDAAHAEEVRRRDHVIAGLIERLPALAGGQDAPTAHHDARHGAEGSNASHASWARRLWRRLMGTG